MARTRQRPLLDGEDRKGAVVCTPGADTVIDLHCTRSFWHAVLESCIRASRNLAIACHGITQLHSRAIVLAGSQMHRD